MPKNANLNNLTLTNVNPAANAPLVKPEAVKDGKVSDASDKAALATETVAGLAYVKEHVDIENDRARRIHDMAAIKEATAAYWRVVDQDEKTMTDAKSASERESNARQSLAFAIASAVIDGSMSRSEARHYMGETFGFAVSQTTGKPTSRPLEPGNTTAKRISAVTIAAEYAINGTLPERGGDSIALVDREHLQDLLSDYFEGNVGLWEAYRKVEAAIKEARINIPLEMDADKILKLAGKIETARFGIRKSEALGKAYAALVATIEFALSGDDEEPTD